MNFEELTQANADAIRAFLRLKRWYDRIEDAREPRHGAHPDDPGTLAASVEDRPRLVGYSSAPTGLISFALMLWGLRTHGPA